MAQKQKKENFPKAIYVGWSTWEDEVPWLSASTDINEFSKEQLIAIYELKEVKKLTITKKLE
jgi:hypothetical protein